MHVIYTNSFQLNKMRREFEEDMLKQKLRSISKGINNSFVVFSAVKR